MDVIFYIKSVVYKVQFIYDIVLSFVLKDM